MERIVFVCNYRHVRSPAAAAIAEKIIQDTPSLNLKVTSAALVRSYPGISGEMREAVRRLGYEIGTAPNTTLVGPGIFTPRDLILCFENPQVDKIRSKLQDPAIKISTLSKFAGFPDEEILDPPAFIKETLLSSAVRCIPIAGLRLPIYRMMGYADPRDYEGVLGVHMLTARQIERSVKNTIAMIAENPNA